MKAVILAGGAGWRLSEETETRPKPMIEVGGRPLLWHIMKLYAVHGITDFVVCLGYKGDVVKEFFARPGEPWRVTLADTGDAAMTGARLRRVLPHVGKEPFCLTYGDGVADVDLTALVAHHRRQGTTATVTAVRPPARFGALQIEGERVTSFAEKPPESEAWVNGGFFVLDPGVARYLPDGDGLVWERGPLESLARDGELAVYRHTGFWQPMDTRHDLAVLRQLWDSGAPPWRTWT
jgi:glucose-1-phosphate cytidylyltransferase